MALKSGLFTEVMVSTEDAEISEIAQQFGANVPFRRSAEKANDFATTIDVIKEVLDIYKSQGKEFERVCCMYPTAPLVRQKTLKAGLEKLTREGLDTVFPVVAFSFPIWRSLKLNDGKIEMNWPEHAQTRSQDLPPAYHDAGQWYWFNPEKLGAGLLTANTGALVLSEAEVQDIDTETDWQMAEFKYRFQIEKQDEQL